MNRVDYSTDECNFILSHGRLARVVWVVQDIIGVSPSPGGKPISVGDLWNYVVPPRTDEVVFCIEFIGLLKGPTCRAR